MDEGPAGSGEGVDVYEQLWESGHLFEGLKYTCAICGTVETDPLVIRKFIMGNLNWSDTARELGLVPSMRKEP